MSPSPGSADVRPQSVADAADLVAASLTRHAEQTGLLVAAALAPGTFARSLGPRSAADQGLVSGIVLGLTYAGTVATQDALAALGLGALSLLRRRGAGRRILGFFGQEDPENPRPHVLRPEASHESSTVNPPPSIHTFAPVPM